VSDAFFDREICKESSRRNCRRRRDFSGARVAQSFRHGCFFGLVFYELIEAKHVNVFSFQK